MSQHRCECSTRDRRLFSPYLMAVTCMLDWCPRLTAFSSWVVRSLAVMWRTPDEVHQRHYGMRYILVLWPCVWFCLGCDRASCDCSSWLSALKAPIWVSALRVCNLSLPSACDAVSVIDCTVSSLAVRRLVLLQVWFYLPFCMRWLAIHEMLKYSVEWWRLVLRCI